MSIGELLKEILERIYRLWPFRLVHDWESGVRCRFGNATKLLTSKNGFRGTGLHVFWPLIGDIIVEETNVEVAQTDLQTVTTADGAQVTLSLGFKYRIFNLKTMYQSIHSAEDTVANEIQATAGKCANSLNYEDLTEKLPDHVLEHAGAQLAKWGARIIEVNLIEVAKARTLRLLMSSPATTNDYD